MEPGCCCGSERHPVLFHPASREVGRQACAAGSALRTDPCPALQEPLLAAMAPRAGPSDPWAGLWEGQAGLREVPLEQAQPPGVPWVLPARGLSSSPWFYL